MSLKKSKDNIGTKAKKSGNFSPCQPQLEPRINTT